MKVGIDISQIVYQGTGVARYTEKLVKNLLKIDKTNQYILFFSSLRRKISFQQKIYYRQANSQIKTFKLPPTLLDFLWNRLHICPIENFVGKVDVFHCWDWTQPPSKKAKLVTTVHDLTPWKYPKTLHPRIIATHKKRMEWVKKECDLIIVDSFSTKRDLIEIIGIPKKKIKVIYLGVENKTQNHTPKLKTLRKKYRIKSDYILAVGTREPRKNLERLIKAFSELQTDSAFSELQLVIVGRHGWGKENTNHPTANIQYLGFVAEEDLAVLYKETKVFVYPSLYEGFGLPVLEAMNSGCPVITSNVSSLPELTGRAALLVNPRSVGEIAGAMQKLLKNKQLREDLVKKGLKQAKKFSWQKTAKETLKVYEGLVK